MENQEKNKEICMIFWKKVYILLGETVHLGVFDQFGIESIDDEWDRIAEEQHCIEGSDNYIYLDTMKNNGYIHYLGSHKKHFQFTEKFICEIVNDII